MNNFQDTVRNYKINNNIWMHRNNHYGIKAWEILGFKKERFVYDGVDNKSYISIGCMSGTLSKEAFYQIKNSGNDKFNEFDEVFSKKNNIEKRRFRHSLYKFLFEYQIGDILVIPGHKEIHVFKVVSDIIYGDELKDVIGNIPEKDDFVYFRELEPVRINIPRNGYLNSEFLGTLKNRGTVLDISYYKNHVIEVLAKSEADSLHEKIVNVTSELLLGCINESLSPEQWESIICLIFDKMGADQADVLPKCPSQKEGVEDADVLAVFEKLKIVVFVQAKKYKGEADMSGAIKQINEYEQKYREQYKGYTTLKWIVCSSTKIVNKEDCENNGIRIIDGNEFVRILLDLGINNIDSII